jgi:hypothetical protein
MSDIPHELSSFEMVTVRKYSFEPTHFGLIIQTRVTLGKINVSGIKFGYHFSLQP